MVPNTEIRASLVTEVLPMDVRLRVRMDVWSTGGCTTATAGSESTANSAVSAKATVEPRAHGSFTGK